MSNIRKAALIQLEEQELTVYLYRNIGGVPNKEFNHLRSKGMA